MKLIKIDKNTLQGSVLSLALVMISAFARAQTTQTPPSKVYTPPKTSAPAPARSAQPARPATQPVSHPPTNGIQQPPYRPTTSPGATPTSRTVAPQGSQTAVTRDGRQIEVRPNGRVERVSLRNGTTATFRPDGRIRSITANGVSAVYHTNGSRTVVTHTNGRTLVSTGLQQGYVERPYLARNGRTYVQRTYSVNGATRVYAYRVSSYKGVFYDRYVPAYHYDPAFYAWASSAWPAPVHYNWGWDGDPWYAYYGTYFTPYPAYPSASLWLTDYLIAQNLQLAYQLQDTQAASAGGSANAGTAESNMGGNGYVSPLTPELKQEVASEVQQQLATEQAAATNPGQGATRSSELPPALDPSLRVFLVSTSLDVTASGQDCSLTPGDWITRIGDSADANQQVLVLVTTSKKADCPAGSQVPLSVQQLQEMHNSFAQHLDDGIDTIARERGKDGLPVPPNTQTSPGEIPAPSPDANVQTALRDQQKALDQTGDQVQQEGLAGQGSQGNH